jgi:predicted transcriptional regulator of viral defense system
VADRTALRNRLAALAAAQSGYFTAAQARELGYDYSQHTFHTCRGNWVRVERGLYRLPHWPVDRHDDLVRAALRTRGIGVISHESAAAFHELGELDPLRTHVSVPRSFRASVTGLSLHPVMDLGNDDVEDQGAFRVTNPMRTLIDLGRSSTDGDQLSRALADALDRHLVTRRAVRARSEAVDVRAALAIERALAEIGG